MLRRSRNQSGDTLVEVLFAVAVFSLVAVGGMSVMNAGLSTVQRSLEISLAREEMDSQAEVIRFMHDSYITAYPSIVSGTPAGEWKNIIDSQLITAASKLSDCSAPTGSFVVNTKTAKVKTSSITGVVPTYSQIRYEQADQTVVSAAEGIWVEAVKDLDSNKFIDFHIRACWDSAGSRVPVTLGTIVRLYEP